MERVDRVRRESPQSSDLFHFFLHPCRVGSLAASQRLIVSQAKKPPKNLSGPTITPHVGKVLFPSRMKQALRRRLMKIPNAHQRAQQCRRTRATSRPVTCSLSTRFWLQRLANTACQLAERRFSPSTGGQAQDRPGLTGRPGCCGTTGIDIGRFAAERRPRAA